MDEVFKKLNANIYKAERLANQFLIKLDVKDATLYSASSYESSAVTMLMRRKAGGFYGFDFNKGKITEFRPYAGLFGAKKGA